VSQTIPWLRSITKLPIVIKGLSLSGMIMLAAADITLVQVSSLLRSVSIKRDPRVHTY
jgi:hypothetical protein